MGGWVAGYQNRLGLQPALNRGFATAAAAVDLCSPPVCYMQGECVMYWKVASVRALAEADGDMVYGTTDPSVIARECWRRYNGS